MVKVVNEIKEGMSVSEIQAVLKVSEKTIYDKLNVIFNFKNAY